ncbi:MAG: hypothetical protein R6X20_05405 [Phycisphaerae bacterium]
MSQPRTRALAAAVTAALALSALAGCQRGAARTEAPTLTIVLLEYKGPQAVDSARRLAAELAGQGLQDVFIIKGHEHAAVCVGHFGSWKDPEADRTLQRVRRIRDAQGQYPFAGVMLMPVPEPLPENPWPVEEADGQYTLIVASWQNPGRMARAQDYARRLRDKGYEAYVYHGPSKSTVSVGAFGPEIFDDPSKVGRPDVHPKIVDPKVKRLRQKFPTLILEGEPAPAEAKLKPYVAIIPGRRAAAPATPHDLPDALYRVTISLVDTRTGLIERPHWATGVAQGRDQLPTLVGALVRQLMQVLDPEGRARVGVAGVAADTDRAAVEPLVLEALPAALRTAGVGKIRLYSREGTAQILRASNLTAEQVLRAPHVVENLEDLDFVVIARVTREM